MLPGSTSPILNFSKDICYQFAHGMYRLCYYGSKRCFHIPGTRKGNKKSAGMNRTDRLLAIVLELQGRGRQRAEDLAETFETSKRTIYRDIQALGQAGVPLISVPGRGYALMKGYFLPPLSFTADEATMLLLGSDFMAQNFDAQYRQAAQSASRKIEGVLPEKLRDEVRYLQSSFHFISAVRKVEADESNILQQLRRAIIEC